MTNLALVPAIVGIVEAVLLYTGHTNVVYAFYGPAARAVTQGFSVFTYGSSGHLFRLSSTFSFVAQYSFFMSAMTAIAYANWRSKGGTASFVSFAVILVACLTSGERASLVLVPLLLLGVTFLEVNPKRILVPLGLIIAGLIGSATLFRSNLAEVLGFVFSTGLNEFQPTSVDTMARALQMAKLGLGTGINTGAARYVADPAALLNESWWVKIVFEIGIPGLIIVGALFVWIALTGVAGHRRLQDPRLRSISAALLGFVLWVMLYNVKGPVIDLDPTNVYFWLFAGLLLRIPDLAQQEQANSDVTAATLSHLPAANIRPLELASNERSAW